VNGLQDVCHNLVISALPWTNAQYQQLVGRFVRLGQKNDVNVYIIKAKFVAPGRGNIHMMKKSNAKESCGRKHRQTVQ
jgi:hypothetical protein